MEIGLSGLALVILVIVLIIGKIKDSIDGRNR
jgi:hypothetical protein